eukprot:27730-Pelagococcus_subviridis.AAC.7
MDHSFRSPRVQGISLEPSPAPPRRAVTVSSCSLQKINRSIVASRRRSVRSRYSSIVVHARAPSSSSSSSSSSPPPDAAPAAAAAAAGAVLFFRWNRFAIRTGAKFPMHPMRARRFAG